MSNKKLFLTFISDWDIYSNEARSFLEYFQNSNHPFSAIAFPDNLYSTSEKLTEDNLGFTARCQLPNNTQTNIVVSLIPNENNLTILNFELGGIEVADYLIGEFGTVNNITWLSDLMAAGGRMMGAKCVQISLEERPNQTIKSLLEDGFLYLEEIPLMFWTSAFLSPQIEKLKDVFWRANFQEDGAWLLIHSQLPRQELDRPSSSVWLSETGSNLRYFLIPNNIILPEGNRIVKNLNEGTIEVDEGAISPFEVKEEIASVQVQNQVKDTIARSLTIFSNLISDPQDRSSSLASQQISPSTNTPTQTVSNLVKNYQNLERSTASNLISDDKKADILVSIMGMTKAEAEDNPQAVKKGFINLLKQFREIISGSISNDKEQLETARSQTERLNNILSARGVDTGGIFKSFPNNLQTLSSQQGNNFQSFISQLDALCEELEKSSTDPKNSNLDRVLKGFNDSYRQLFGGEDPEKVKAKQEQKYREMTKETFKQARDKYPMPSLKLKDLWPKD